MISEPGSREIFERLAAAIARACEDKDARLVRQVADELSLRGHRVRADHFGERYTFIHEAADGRVVINYSRCDESRWVRVEPDWHIFWLTFDGRSGETLTLCREFESCRNSHRPPLGNAFAGHKTGAP